jgi:hypothetical protein
LDRLRGKRKGFRIKKSSAAADRKLRRIKAKTTVGAPSGASNVYYLRFWIPVCTGMTEKSRNDGGC